MAPRRKTALLSLYPLKQAVAGVIAPVEGRAGSTFHGAPCSAVGPPQIPRRSNQSASDLYRYPQPDEAMVCERYRARRNTVVHANEGCCGVDRRIQHEVPALLFRTVL